MLLDAFQSHLKQQFPFLTAHTKLLVAVSGGLDSTVLVHLCMSSGLDISIAHCNFNLRGNESDGDAHFVKKLATEHTLPYYEKSFDTSAYAKKHTVSTQMAARDLRYTWFKELTTAEGYDYILTAHHSNDNLETFLINVSRGTGLDGLTGIPAISGNVLRLLLPFSRKRIYEYAQVNEIVWREDSSNASDAYVRNAMRHHVIPELEKIRPDILQTVEKTLTHVQQSASLLEVYIQELKTRYFYPLDSLIGPRAMCVSIPKLLEHPTPKAVLYVLYKDFGFTAWEDVYHLLEAQSGKQLFSQTHRLLKDRTTLQLYSYSKEKETNTTSFLIEEGIQEHQGDYGTLSFARVATMATVLETEIYIDPSKVQFPMVVRRWKEGDFFYPSGMQGKKKLSKFFKDEKLSLVAKENTWLLCDQNGIIWILGYRSDRRYSAQEDTKLLKITYSI
ncbi:tRNA lysidine(34) synthetase TilS [uncultured Dokdonia sp.]|uniref:tRNA lysidine(34) synthetase TilS n=1 Tax=uncultured Dokdonia sp. TaxID=575653 RepID=UPI00260B815E|nr:tRNA lysidine(34) synthetase TilS [uncultured Dokdonia sp.]